MEHPEWGAPRATWDMYMALKYAVRCEDPEITDGQFIRYPEPERNKRGRSVSGTVCSNVIPLGEDHFVHGIKVLAKSEEREKYEGKTLICVWSPPAIYAQDVIGMGFIEVVFLAKDDDFDESAAILQEAGIRITEFTDLDELDLPTDFRKKGRIWNFRDKDYDNSQS